MNTLPPISGISAIFYDCDGVLTDNRVLVTEQGIESVFFNRSDGLAIAEFLKLGIHQAIISTETNNVVERRAEKLKIPVMHKLDTQSLDKGTVLQNYASQYNISLVNSIFIGNDINDLPALKLVGYPCCPADAEIEVRSFCESQNGWVSTKPGGYGVVRELYRELSNK